MESKWLQEPEINIVGNEIGLFDDIALHIKDETNHWNIKLQERSE